MSTMPHVAHHTAFAAGAHRRTWHIACDMPGCGHQEARFWRELSDAETAAGNFRRQGWVVGDRNICPACQKAARQAKKERSSMSVGNALNAVKVFKKLEEVFAGGRYAAGWSDERVGKECGGLSKAFVAEIREAEIGPIKGDPEVDALKADVASLEEMLTAVKTRLAKVEQRIR
jgi:glycine/D-amino acid oxidase-like deaminating enzyme